MTAARPRAGQQRRGVVAALLLGAANLLAADAMAAEPAASGASAASVASVASGTSAASGAASAASLPPTGEWLFRALLDGAPIGEHRFSVSGRGDERRVVSEARFEVRILGITAYRYHHRATEHWQGGCLAALQSTTDDDGKASEVRAERAGAALRVERDGAARRAGGDGTTRRAGGDGTTLRAGGDGTTLPVDAPDDAMRTPPPDCVMSFAYWNPAIRGQTRLLNAQNGKLETVQVQRAGSSGSIEVRGKTVPATEYRITGAAQPISVWYAAEGHWVGLDSIVAGGRKLSYRLF